MTTTINIATAISDLKRDHDHYNQNRKAWPEAKRQAKWTAFRAHAHQVATLFGDLNGWTPTDLFTPDAIGRTRRTAAIPDLAGWMDHGFGYRAGRRLVAIVGQPYNTVPQYRDTLDDCAARYGLRWQVAPMGRASFWFPGWTLFIVMTRPDVQVHWLPEQINAQQFADAKDAAMA
jgi:hypothetical protein